jgi:hypothetical protein
VTPQQGNVGEFPFLYAKNAQERLRDAESGQRLAQDDRAA